MCRSDGVYTSPHSGHKGKEAWRGGGKHYVQHDASQEYKEWYNCHRKGGMQHDPSLGRRVMSDSPLEGWRFRQSRQGRQKHPGVSDEN
jgi:hypothetical protein